MLKKIENTTKTITEILDILFNYTNKNAIHCVDNWYGWSDDNDLNDAEFEYPLQNIVIVEFNSHGKLIKGFVQAFTYDDLGLSVSISSDGKSWSTTYNSLIVLEGTLPKLPTVPNRIRK
jgi:hypothetical protein